MSIMRFFANVCIAFTMKCQSHRTYTNQCFFGVSNQRPQLSTVKTSRLRNELQLTPADPLAVPPYEETVEAEEVVVVMAAGVVRSTTATTDQTPSLLTSNPDTRLHLHRIFKAVEDHHRCRRTAGFRLRLARNTMDMVLLLDRVSMISIIRPQ